MVQIVRHLIAQRHLVMLLCAATLLLKLIVPTGYMLAADDGRVAIVLCSGTGPVAPTMAGMMHAGMKRGDVTDRHAPGEKGKAEMPCAFVGLSAATLGAIDPILLVTLIAFVLATTWLVAVPPLPVSPVRLRPPLRGPPRFA